MKKKIIGLTEDDEPNNTIGHGQYVSDSVKRHKESRRGYGTLYTDTDKETAKND